MTDGPITWRVPGYVEERQLGAGAQGRVVRAADVDTGEPVAIKYLAADLLSSDLHLRMFAREAELLQRVANPHVARLHSFVRAEEGAAIVMEAIEGSSLRTVLTDRAGHPLGPEEALVMLKGSLLGLAAAHETGVIHRDYKPANVIVQPDGSSKLIDFGIAVLMGEGDRAGTPAYMSPEQWCGGPATPSSDVYAATCVFYECVTGHKPFQSGEVDALMAEHTSAPIPVEAVPDPLRPLVAHGMAKDPAQRPAGASDFVAELEDLAVTAYGPDWERVGLLALGTAATALAAAASGTAAATAVTGHAAAAHSVGTSAFGQTGQQIVQTAGKKGALAKVGGTKGAVGIAGGLAAVTAATVVIITSQHDPPALRYREARQVLATFISTANRAYATLDTQLLPRVMTEPLLGVEQGTVSWALRYHTSHAWSWSWRNPTFWIPRIHGKRQRWFATMAGPGSDKGDVGVVLVFAKQRAGWRAVISTYPTQSLRYPHVPLDKHGFATEVRANDRHYLISPREIPKRLSASQNLSVQNGGTSTGDPAFASGPCTTGWGKDGAGEIQSASDHGWTQSLATFGSSGPVFALKTIEGSLVWLTQTRANHLFNAKGNARWFYRPSFTDSTKVSAVQFRHSMDVGILIQSAVVDPLGASGQVRGVSCNSWLHDFRGN